MKKPEIEVIDSNLELVESTGTENPESCGINECENTVYFNDGMLISPSTKIGKRWEIKIVTIGNWPEFKTKTCHKKVCTPLGCVRVPYPCVYCRTCKKTFYGQIVLDAEVPGGFEEALKQCAKIAAIPAIPLLIAGQVQAALALFIEGVKTCMLAKGFEIASKLSIGIHSRKECNAWHKC